MGEHDVHLRVCDIFSFYKPGVVRDILRGKVWEFDITQGWALGALALMTIPALMVFLSVGVRPALSRWANIVVAGLYVVVSLGNLAGESWAYLYLGAAIEVALLVTIIRYAWTWPRRSAELSEPLRDGIRVR